MIRSARAALALSLAVSGCAGCTSPRSPEAACELFVRGIAEGDPSTVYDSLMQTTQWSFSTVQKNHRAMRAIIRESYPSDQHTAGLARLYGADADSGRDLFVSVYLERYQADLTARLGSGPVRVVREPGDTAASCQRTNVPPGSKPYRVARTSSGRWGFAEIDREWEEAKLRAVHDLETVKKNAELFQRAR